MDYQLMGQKVRMHRRRKGLTQAKLAELTQVSTSFIGHIERGSRKASLETLAKICRVLSISMDAVAMPPRCEQVVFSYTKEQVQKAKALLEAALDMCR